MLSPPSSPLTPISSQEDEEEEAREAEGLVVPSIVPGAVRLEYEPVIPDSEEEAVDLVLIQPQSPRILPFETDDEDAHRTKRSRIDVGPDTMESIQLIRPAPESTEQPVDQDAPVPASSQTLVLPSSPPPADNSGARSKFEEEEEELKEMGMTVSQDMAAFIAGMDPSELDMLPSSEPAHLSSPPPRRRFPGSSFLSHDSTRRSPQFSTGKEPLQGNEADDSGYFPAAEEDLPSESLLDGDLVGEDPIFPVVEGEDDDFDNVGDENSEGAFAGDEMWEGFDETLACGADVGRSSGIVLNGNGSSFAAQKEPEGTGLRRGLGERSRAEEDEDEDKFYEPGNWDQPNFGLAPDEMPTFKSGNGKAIVLSEAALSKARAFLVDEDSTVADPPLDFATLPNSTPSSSTASHIPHPIAALPTSSVNLNAHFVTAPHYYPPTFTRTSFPTAAVPECNIPPTTTGGFTDGRGTKFAPSADALARARKLLASSPPAEAQSSTRPGHPLPSTIRPTLVPFSRPSMTTQNEMPSLNSSEAMIDRDVFSERTSPTGVPSKRRTFNLASHNPLRADGTSSTLKKPAGRIGSTTLRGPFVPMENERLVASHPSSPTRPSGSGQRLAGPSSDPASYPQRHDASSPHPRPIASTSVAAPVPSSSYVAPIRPTQFPSSTPFKVPAFRPPMKNSGTPLSAIRPSISRPTELKSTPLKSGSAIRRVNIGMTPGRRPMAKSHKFMTPFKNGVVPVGLTPSGVISSIKKPPASDLKGKGKGKEVVVPVTGQESTLFEPVFDLTPKGPRVGLREIIVRPQSRSLEHLESIGIPEEVLAMDSVSAVSFVFGCGRSEAAALTSLKAAGCSLVNEAWVKNHYSLIVWKLASLVRSNPTLLEQYWSWEAALDQLKYRYEREVNHAQRSAVKRIQEQDSSAGLPIVLCVSMIQWGDSPDAENEQEDKPLVIVGLELTDGWYRIRANVDGTLKSACERGKIAVGCKLVICGARIESSREGTEVLEALNSSSLVISGNSTSLAPWDAKLGFIRQRQFASLKTLTVAGGVASILDVIVERVFPTGYLDLAKGGNHGTWNEEEEHVRADEWQRGREKALAKLADELERTDGDWDEIIEILRERACRLGLPSSSDSHSPRSDAGEPDEVLDQIEAASNKDAIIDRLSPTMVQECLKLALDYAREAKVQAISDLEKDLASSFPPREVRSFRALRIRDAQVPSHGFSSPRTAILTVWDANTLGDEFFIAGHRYFVSSVIPKGMWKRNTQEITLATRRDTRWEKVE